MMAEPPFHIFILNRLGFGATAESITAFQQSGATDDERLDVYLQQQFSRSGLDETALNDAIQFADLESIPMSVQQLWSTFVRGDQAAALPVHELELYQMIRAMYSNYQLYERMVHFWHDHFTVNGELYINNALFPHYDREVIRPHAFGNFRQLLGAVSESSLSLFAHHVYRNSSAGPNHHWSRLLFHHYTLGLDTYFGSTTYQYEVDGFPNAPVGYVDQDIFEASRCFTGWSIEMGWNSDTGQDTGERVFRENQHDRFQKLVLGQYFDPDQKPEQDGRLALDVLCAHPATATHIATKLCKRFVSDEPSAALISSTAQVFTDYINASDQIERMLRHIISSNEFRTSWGQKNKSPFHSIISTMRILEYPFVAQRDHPFSNFFRQYYHETGHRLFHRESINGYSDQSSAWHSTNAFVKTFRLVGWVLETKLNNVRLFNELKDMPVSVNTTAEIVDHWMMHIFGYEVNEKEYASFTKLMSQGANPNLPLDIQTNSDLQGRLRTLIGVMCMSPSFYKI